MYHIIPHFELNTYRIKYILPETLAFCETVNRKTELHHGYDPILICSCFLCNQKVRTGKMVKEREINHTNYENSCLNNVILFLLLME